MSWICVLFAVLSFNVSRPYDPDKKHGHDIKTRVGNGQLTRLVVFGVCVCVCVVFFLISWCGMFLLASGFSRLADLVGSRTNVEIHSLYGWNS